MEARCSWRHFTKHWTSIDQQASSRGRNTHLPPSPGRYSLPRRPSRPRKDAPPCPVPTLHSARREVKPSLAYKLRLTRPQPRPRRASDSGRPAVGDSSCPAQALRRACGPGIRTLRVATPPRGPDPGTSPADESSRQLWAPTRRMMPRPVVSEAPPYNFRVAGSATGAARLTRALLGPPGRWVQHTVSEY